VTTYSETPLFGPADPATVSDVTCVDADHRRERDRAEIDAAIEFVATTNEGRVDSNAVRALLQAENGELTVNPRALSARYMALKHAGVLRWDGEWTESTDRAGKNAGRPMRVYVYVGEAA
jgi:hypothetical protein